MGIGISSKGSTGLQLRYPYKRCCSLCVLGRGKRREAATRPAGDSERERERESRKGASKGKRSADPQTEQADRVSEKTFRCSRANENHGKTERTAEVAEAHKRRLQRVENGDGGSCLSYSLSIASNGHCASSNA